jgi:hypothetical protein
MIECGGRHRGFLKDRAANRLRALQAEGRLGPLPILRNRGIRP